ncbi:MAG: proteasome subunit beta [Nitrospirota bacterium]|nr:proteasome subunit beta [Nitrospirota bacterium]
MRGDAFSPQAGASFYDYLVSVRPDLLPTAIRGAMEGPVAVPHGTTVVALVYAGGVVIAGDRMASDGHSVSSRHMDKVIRTDRHSAMAISGAVGPCLDMARLFATELEYYEKIEGRALSLSGKANKLAQMVRGNLALAMQGLAVIPVFAGFDPERGAGRVFKYDVAGGKTEEPDYVTAGSGGGLARSAIKRAFRPGMDEAGALGLALASLLDAADEDLATAGPDPQRGIFPSALVIDADGAREVDADHIRQVCGGLPRPGAGPDAGGGSRKKGK